MRISLASKGDIISIYSRDLGINVVERIKDKEIVGKRFYGLMYAVKRALALIKPYMEEELKDEIVTFELSNSTLVKWFQFETPNKDYEVYFTGVIEELNMIPMRYNFVYLGSVEAKKYLDASNIKQLSLSGLEDML